MKIKLTILLALLLSTTLFAQTKDYAKWVNPFIGTGGHGHTFPGATMPFGMVQLSPDTRIDNWDGSSGYHYSDDTIYGFSHTHLSGTGIPDGCDILFMPMSGVITSSAKEGDKSVNGYASKFSHANEKAEPGYYSVKLDDDNILAEMTSTARVGLHRYTFPDNAKNRVIVLDLNWRDKVKNNYAAESVEARANAAPSDHGLYLNVVSDTRIEGYRRSSSWAKNQVVYFVAEFSAPFRSSVGSNESSRYLKKYGFNEKTHGAHAQTYSPSIDASFSFASTEPIVLKVAISSVSIEGARKNLAAELPGWDFDKVRADAKAAWNKELSKIEVSGGTDAQTTTFYTALYHTMTQPNVFNDVDGNYRGLDKKIHNICDGQTGSSKLKTRNCLETSSQSAVSSRQSQRASPQYTVFSLWDTFRAAHPLYTIIDERRTVDFINTFIRQYEQGGRLPVWELWGEETDTMIGYHAVSVIADAMGKGIKGFDYEKAYGAAKHSAELEHFGLKDYKRRGYISMEDEHESVSKTLEYAYNDWCIAQMALILATQRLEEFNRTHRTVSRPNTFYKEFEDYSQRARNFENLFDPSTGFMRPKKNGGWVSPFAPNEVTFNFTEGNSWVYSFFVPHDVSRLMQLNGGEDKFVEKLDSLFTTTDKLAGREQPDITGLIGQYAHGNEPSHHIAYLYNYAHQPWKTQNLVRKIMDEFYKPEPDGLIGNEDCGQMSAWYILSASGFYPVAPGDGIYAFGTPLFPEMTYRLENGKTFTVRAKNVSSTNKYILNAKLNGAPYKKAFIKHQDIMNGGVLEFAMIDKPVETAFTQYPLSSIGLDSVPLPYIESGRFFGDETNITLKTIDSGAEIFWTTDPIGTLQRWSKYTQPIRSVESVKLQAYSVSSNGNFSQKVEAEFRKKPNDWTVKIEHKYNRQYTGGGDEGLIDGIRGTINFASGEWQGYQPKDLIATIDLQGETTVSELGGGFLQNARSWIWMPTRIVFETSMDGVTFTKAAEIKTDIAPTDMKEQIKDFVTKITPIKARYVRVHAYNLGKIPSWHPGAGDDTFIFVDEIIIQ